jgi:glycosyltransferase involved in cell wall biosynthesis
MATMLIVSRYCAFAKAAYAGTHTHRYYLENLRRDFDLRVVTVADPADAPCEGFAKRGIEADVIYIDENPRRVAFFLLFNWQNIFNYFGKTLGIVNGYVRRQVLKRLKVLSRQGYRPDFIILEWTQTVLMVKSIKSLFPGAKCIASEHDVSFVRFQRLLEAARGAAAIKERLRSRSVKKAELSSLRECNLVVPHNLTDARRLIDQGLPPHSVHHIAPFHADYGEVAYDARSTSILFFGAMDRAENYLSVAWFIERVFRPSLAGAFTLCIVGIKPHPSLDKYRSDKITITGFVPDVRPYLESSVCMVAPLLQGAGIKVKVIEAMGAGLPVVGNAVAVEGIPARDGVHYLHAEKPEDYVRRFDAIREGRVDLRAMSAKAKELVAATFNLEKSYEAYKKAIEALKGNTPPTL